MRATGLKYWCSPAINPDCGTKLALKLLAKSREKKEKAKRAELRVRKDNLTDGKARKDAKARAVTYCHKYVRMRDAGKPCPSCGRNESEIRADGDVYNGQIWDAGHYRSRGAMPMLSFEELNIHRQCKKCNGTPEMNGAQESVRLKFQKELIIRLGQDVVDWLDGPHDQKRYRIQDFKNIAAQYKDKIKTLNVLEC